MRANNALLADLIAVTMNAHMRDEDGGPLHKTRADFLRTPDDDGDEDEPIDDGEEMGAPLHPMLQSGITGAAGIRPTGTPVPQSIMNLFQGANADEGKDE